jgi:peptidoglycan/xylan/chitin deacetylase (PgdA/CDA1 family)
MSPSSQTFGAFPDRGPAMERRIALTFDDGPNEPYTSALLATLQTLNVSATFFQVGANVERHPDTARAVLAAGHVIGNHSYAHRFGRGLRPAAVRAEIDRAQDVFADHLGIAPGLYRPPWLVRTPSLFSALRDRRMHAVSGRFAHPLEVAQIASARIAAYAQVQARPGHIVIFHDGYNSAGAHRGRTVEAVGMLIERLQSSGATFTTVDKLLGVPAYLT